MCLQRRERVYHCFVFTSKFSFTIHSAVHDIYCKQRLLHESSCLNTLCLQNYFQRNDTVCRSFYRWSKAVKHLLMMLMFTHRPRLFHNSLLSVRVKIWKEHSSKHWNKASFIFHLFSHYLGMNVMGEIVTTICISAILVHHLRKVMSHALENRHHGFTEQRCHLLG